MDTLDNAFTLAEQNITREDKNPLFWNLRDAFITRELKGLTKEITYSFQSFMLKNKQSKSLDDRQLDLLDMRHPQEWFPATRQMQRTFHVHVGPTNSGKTYQALKALEKAKTGCYAGPLRLLATETYHRLLEKGRACALLTGEEVRIPTDADVYLRSCTVEMIPINVPMDVAVIDEIQMLMDDRRGDAWTSALLGVQAKEVHVCGEERAVKAVQALCASVGDKCIVHRYERLSPLETADEPLGNSWSQLRKGDAVVAFSRLALHAIKRNIEAQTGRRCAIIYGSLPPEVRVQQAALFNDPDNDYDFVAASDAIGMGLNLEIKRVVMESIHKFDGVRNRMLHSPEIKQIGGRAGRFRSARNASDEVSTDETPKGEPQPGIVTALDGGDLRAVRKAFTRPVDDIATVQLAPPTGIIEKFAAYYPPETPLSFLLTRMKMKAQLGKHHSYLLDPGVLEVADLIQDIPLALNDRLLILALPASLRVPGAAEIVRALAKLVAENKEGKLVDIPEIPLELLDEDIHEAVRRDAVEYLYKLEGLFSALSQYTWLSYRYAGVFTQLEVALHARKIVGDRLVEVLEHMDFTAEDLVKLRKKNRRMAAKVAATEAKRSKLVQKEDGAEGEDDSPLLSARETEALNESQLRSEA